LDVVIKEIIEERIGGYVVLGSSNFNGSELEDFAIWLIKIDSNGNVRNVPRNRAHNTPFLNFLQNYPNMFPILQRLLFQRLGLQ
jgi:hypothetical protein